MKRKDFLRKVRGRRRAGALEHREPEQRRAADWRTLRVELPGEGQPEPSPQELPVGRLRLLPDGVRLEAGQACWVRGYRSWEAEGGRRAEFQYKAVEPGTEPPPGATALEPGQTWEP